MLINVIPNIEQEVITVCYQEAFRQVKSEFQFKHITRFVTREVAFNEHDEATSHSYRLVCLVNGQVIPFLSSGQ